MWTVRGSGPVFWPPRVDERNKQDWLIDLLFTVQRHIAARSLGLLRWSSASHLARRRISYILSASPRLSLFLFPSQSCSLSHQCEAISLAYVLQGRHKKLSKELSRQSHSDQPTKQLYDLYRPRLRKLVTIILDLIETFISPQMMAQQSKREKKLCEQMPNVMVVLSNIGGALCSPPQSLADAHYWSAVQ